MVEGEPPVNSQASKEGKVVGNIDRRALATAVNMYEADAELRRQLDAFTQAEQVDPDAPVAPSVKGGGK